MNESDADRDVALELIAPLKLPRPWNMTRFLTDLALSRQRAIRVEPLVSEMQPELARAASGLWVPQESYDLILVSEHVPADRRPNVITHEIGHILGWDRNRHVAPTLHYLKRTFPHIPENILAKRAVTVCYTRDQLEHPVERQAEWFATLLMARAKEREQRLVPADASGRQQRMGERAAQVFGWDP